MSNNTTYGCDWSNTLALPDVGSALYGTLTWHDICWVEKRNRLILWNWEEIWDLSWNVMEYVNLANTLDWTGHGSMNANVCWDWWDNDTDRYSYFKNASDVEFQCFFRNWYSYSNIWPLMQDLNSSNGIWRIYSYKVNDSTITSYARWWWASNATHTGIYTLYKFASRVNFVWFRCAK